MKRSRTISRPEEYQTNDLHETTFNKGSQNNTPRGATTEPTKAPKVDTAVMSTEDKIQEDKIDDVAQENDTMHNPDMSIDNSRSEKNNNMESPDENPNKEYDYDDDKVRRSDVVA